MITEKFSILGHLDKLTPAKGKNRYICPVCGGNNFTIAPVKDLFQCWDGCTFKEVATILAPLKPGEKAPISPKAGKRKPRPEKARKRVSEDNPCQICGEFDTPCSFTAFDVLCAIAMGEPDCPDGYIHMGEFEGKQAYVKVNGFEPEPEKVDPASSESWQPDERRERRSKVVPFKKPESEESPSNSEAQIPRFESSPDKGLLWHSHEKDGTGEMRLSQTRIGNHLAAIAYLNSPDQDSAAILLEFQTQQGHVVRWSMPRRELGGDKSAIIGELLARGYGLVYEQQRKLGRYITELGYGIEEKYVISERTGWINDSFLLPNRTVGDQQIRFRDVEPQPNSPTETMGTAQSWTDSVGRMSRGNSRLIFTIGCSFSAPLLEPLGLEGGGFHLVGASSVGKTTCLNVAASVAGQRKLTQWNATVNGLEAVAEGHNHLLLPLDEIGQSYPKDVAQAAYLLANGQGKQRMSKALQSRKPKEWRLLFLSSGEIGLAQYLKDGKINVKSGQEARMPDIPAVPSTQSYGVFECIHGYESPAKFVAALESACQQNRGTPLDAFLTYLINKGLGEVEISKLNRDLWAKTQSLTGDIADEVIGRAAKRFALVWLALELAYGFGLMPLSIGECEWAVRSVFEDWISARGGVGSVEIKQSLEKIEHEFVTSEFSDRIYDLDAPQIDSSGNFKPIRNLLAYKKDDLAGGLEFWVPPSVFRELTSGVDREALIAEMQSRGWLKTGDAEGKAALRRYLNGKLTRFYVFQQFWNSENPGVMGVMVSCKSQKPYPDRILSHDTPMTPEKGSVSWVSCEVHGDTKQHDTMTPGKNDVSCTGETQDPVTERVLCDMTPMTPMTPQKHDLGKTDRKVGDYVIPLIGDHAGKKLKISAIEGGQVWLKPLRGVGSFGPFKDSDLKLLTRE